MQEENIWITKQEDEKMYLIVGLGNPTAKYAKTRHNAGIDVIDAIADKYGIDMNLKKGNAICGTGYI